jgi:hypothetical protein
MFRDLGYRDEAVLSTMIDKFLPWVGARIESGDCLGWLAINERDLVVAGVGFWFMDWPAHMLASSSRRGNIFNVPNPHSAAEAWLDGSSRRIALVQSQRNRFRDIARQCRGSKTV